MELGVLVTGGSLPGQVQEHFDWLIFNGTLGSIRTQLRQRGGEVPKEHSNDL
jgi:hypothetical protein